jgi:Rrf2 family protein
VELSGKIEYALLALLELTANYAQREPLQIRQIAAQQQIPDRYLEQLLATLRRGGLTVSQRGAKGGYLLAKEPWQITLLEVVECLEGSDCTKNEMSTDTVESAVVEEVWQEITTSTRKILQGYTLQDLCEKGNARRQLNIMYYI